MRGWYAGQGGVLLQPLRKSGILLASEQLKRVSGLNLVTGYRAVEHGVPGTRPADCFHEVNRAEASVQFLSPGWERDDILTGVVGSEPKNRLDGKFSALTDARKYLAYDFANS